MSCKTCVCRCSLTLSGTSDSIKASAFPMDSATRSSTAFSASLIQSKIEIETV